MCACHYGAIVRPATGEHSRLVATGSDEPPDLPRIHQDLIKPRRGRVAGPFDDYGVCVNAIAIFHQSYGKSKV